MSYEKIKCITRKPKEGKIFITSASNNVSPKTYSKWEFMPDSLHNKEKVSNKELYLYLSNHIELINSQSEKSCSRYSSSE